MPDCCCCIFGSLHVHVLYSLYSPVVCSQCVCEGHVTAGPLEFTLPNRRLFWEGLGVICFLATLQYTVHAALSPILCYGPASLVY